MENQNHKPVNRLTEFNSGGQHHQNRLGGIPQGIGENGLPNLVEEGETKLNSQDYIFSNKLSLTPLIAKEYGIKSKYVGKSFADISKAINDSNSRRTNDAIENKSKEMVLNNLMYAQEKYKKEDFEEKMSSLIDTHPDIMQMPITPTDPSIEETQMKKGGYMYDFGGALRNFGDFLSNTSPLLSKIPGVGPVIGTAAGAVGGGLSNVGTDADIQEILKDSALGAVNGIAGTIPMGGMIASTATNLLDDNKFPDGGSLSKPNPYYKQQSSLFNTWNNPTVFPQYKQDRFIEGPELDAWYNNQIKNNPTLLEESGMFVGGYKPNRVYLGDSEDQYYPTYSQPAKTITIPPTPTSDLNTGFVKPVEEVVEAPTENISYSNKPQTYYTQDAEGNWGEKQIRSVPYAKSVDGGKYELLNTPGIVWIDSQGNELTTDPTGATQMAEGGFLNSPPYIDPAVIQYLQQMSQLQQAPNLNITQSGLPDYNQSQQMMQNQLPTQNVNTSLTEETIIPSVQPTVEDEGAALLDETYKSQLQLADESLTDANQDLRVQQTPLAAIGEALPVAYNIGMGLFGKPQQLDVNDYISKSQIEAPKINVTPQIRQAEQSYATAAEGVKSASPSAGAYMTNLQQLANNRNQQLGSILTNKENIDAANQMQADQFNASMNANNNQLRFAIEDYNARSKGAKQGTLAEGLTQLADIGRNETSNKLATSYYGLTAPDFKNQVGYTSFFEYLGNKMKNNKNQ